MGDRRFGRRRPSARADGAPRRDGPPRGCRRRGPAPDGAVDDPGRPSRARHRSEPCRRRTSPPQPRTASTSGRPRGSLKRGGYCRPHGLVRRRRDAGPLPGPRRGGQDAGRCRRWRARSASSSSPRRSSTSRTSPSSATPRRRSRTASWCCASTSAASRRAVEQGGELASDPVGVARRRGGDRVTVQARRPPRPGARRPGVRQRGCAPSATTSARRWSWTTSVAGFASPTAAAGSPSGCRPDLQRVEQGDRQRPPARGRRSATAGWREGANAIFATGSFWIAAVPMAADLATIDALGSERADGVDGAEPVSGSATAWPAKRRPTAWASTRPGRCRCR